MPRGARVQIWAPRAPEVAEKYHRVAERFEDPKRSFKDVIDVFEEGERRHFAQNVHGRYIETGRLYASLTQTSANGALRGIHKGGLNFGTRVDYAVYLSKRADEREAGQVHGGRQSTKPSAVLVLTRRTSRAASKVVMDFIMEPVE